MKVIKMEEVHLTEPLSLAIGFFDGLHLGHMSLINEVLKYKGETKTAVMSFDVHPLCVLKGEKRQSIITLEEKKELRVFSLMVLINQSFELPNTTLFQFHQWGK